MRLVGVGPISDELMEGVLSDWADFARGQVPDLPSALALLEGREAAIALIHLPGEDLSRLSWVPSLSEAGAQVVVLSETGASTARAAAFDAGAADFLFPPLTAPVLEGSLLSLLGRPARREPRFEADLPALVATAKTTLQGRLVDLSRGGFRMRLPAPADTHLALRVGLKPPPPHTVPVLFARAIASEPDEEPGWFRVRGRLVGMSAEDRSLLMDFLGTLTPAPVEIPVALATLNAMDRAMLQGPEVGLIAGVHPPALTALERSGLAAPKDTPQAAFGEVALARARALMIAEVVEQASDFDALHPGSFPYHRWRKELDRAGETVRAALLQALTAGDKSRTAEIRELQSHLAFAEEKVEQIAHRAERHALGEPTGQFVRARIGPLEAPADPAVFERPAPVPPPAPVRASPAGPLPIRRRWISGLSVALVLLAASAGGVGLELSANRRHAHDGAREAVATHPVMVAGRVRVRAMWRDAELRRSVAVIDGSWYEADEAGRREAMRQIEARSGKGLEVRDYLGRVVAVTGSDGRLILR